MTLILSNNDVDKLLSMPECIDVLEEAYVELAEGRGITRTRSDSIAPTQLPDAVYGLKSMDGVCPKLGVGAVRINSDIVRFPKRGNTVVREKVPAAPGNRWVGLVLLFSVDNGEPLAIMPDGVMQRMRVGGTNGLGIKYLARKNAEVVGILGSGWQAGSQLMAACAVRDIKQVRCFSPTRENREKFAAEMSGMLGIEVKAVDQPEDAMKGADIAMCASSSLDNIFFAPWVEAGMHITSIKRPEIEMAALRKADRIVIHNNDEKPIHVMTRDIELAETAKENGWNSVGELDFANLPTLPELIVGRAPGRASDREVTCFLNNIGLGYQFAAVGAAVIRKAKDGGFGHELPTDWFTEDVHP
ncbi:MAG: ornithine cyclodeaminase family protein [Xanthobacteraceae bacterium]|nr:ornithine cyclodeaminase family protein [Xanthobacteraceae bacterium]